MSQIHLCIVGLGYIGLPTATMFANAGLRVTGVDIDARTRAAEKLDAFLAPIDLPVLAHLRDTQNYVTAAFGGKSIFDLAPSLVAQDVAQWQPIIDWIE